MEQILKSPFLLEHPPDISNAGYAIVQVVGFLLLAFVFVKLVWPSMVQPHLDARRVAIADAKQQVEQTHNETREMLGDYRRRLEGIHQETQRRIEDALTEAEALRESILADGRTASAAIIRRGEEEVARERAKAMLQLRADFVESVVGAARHAAANSLDGHQRRLVDGFVRILGSP